MQTQPQLFERYARECERRAEAANNRTLRALFLDLAAEWRELAGLRETLSLEREEREDFYRTSRLAK
jgi:hypothetical protein